MGHKVHPNGFRLGVYRNWEAKWFAPDKEYKPLLLEDVRLRRMLMIRLKNAGLARIETERSSSALTITLHTAKPGIVIGKGGTSVDQLRDELEKITGKRVRVTIQEIKKPELAAQRRGARRQAKARHPSDQGGRHRRKAGRETSHPGPRHHDREIGRTKGAARPRDEEEGIRDVAAGSRQASQAPSGSPHRRGHPGCRPGVR